MLAVVQTTGLTTNYSRFSIDSNTSMTMTSHDYGKNVNRSSVGGSRLTSNLGVIVSDPPTKAESLGPTKGFLKVF